MAKCETCGKCRCECSCVAAATDKIAAAVRAARPVIRSTIKRGE